MERSPCYMKKMPLHRLFPLGRQVALTAFSHVLQLLTEMLPRKSALLFVLTCCQLVHAVDYASTTTTVVTMTQTNRPNTSRGTLLDGIGAIEGQSAPSTSRPTRSSPTSSQQPAPPTSSFSMSLNIIGITGETTTQPKGIVPGLGASPSSGVASSGGKSRFQPFLVLLAGVALGWTVA
jgi:hypothetical protein